MSEWIKNKARRAKEIAKDTGFWAINTIFGLTPEEADWPIKLSATAEVFSTGFLLAMFYFYWIKTFLLFSHDDAQDVETLDSVVDIYNSDLSDAQAALLGISILTLITTHAAVALEAQFNVDQQDELRHGRSRQLPTYLETYVNGLPVPIQNQTEIPNASFRWFSLMGIKLMLSRVIHIAEIAAPLTLLSTQLLYTASDVEETDWQLFATIMISTLWGWFSSFAEFRAQGKASCRLHHTDYPPIFTENLPKFSELPQILWTKLKKTSGCKKDSDLEESGERASLIPNEDSDWATTFNVRSEGLGQFCMTTFSIAELIQLAWSKEDAPFEFLGIGGWSIITAIPLSILLVWFGSVKVEEAAARLAQNDSNVEIPDDKSAWQLFADIYANSKSNFAYLCSSIFFTVLDSAALPYGFFSYLQEHEGQDFPWSTQWNYVIAYLIVAPLISIADIKTNILSLYRVTPDRKKIKPAQKTESVHSSYPMTTLNSSHKDKQPNSSSDEGNDEFDDFSFDFRNHYH